MSTITFGDISDFGDIIPAGQDFAAKATSCVIKTTKSKEDGSGGGKPYLSITLKCLHGDYEGLEITKQYWLSYKKTNGKIYARSISELYADMETINKPMPKDFPFTTSGEDSAGRGTFTNGAILCKEIAKRIAPNVTPRIQVRSIAVRAQEKKLDPQTAKEVWVDAFMEDGVTPKYKVEYVISGKSAAIEQAAGGFDHDDGSTLGDDDADPLKGL